MMTLKTSIGTILLLALALPLGTATLLQAQDSQPAAQPSQTAVAAPALSIKCTVDQSTNDCTTQNELKLGEYVRLRVANLSDWIKTGNSPWGLILFLNGRPMKGLHPIAVNQESGDLDFRLQRSGDNIPVWNEMMEREKSWKWGEVARTLPVSAGLENGVALPSHAHFKMVFLPRLEFLFIAGFSIFSLGVLIVLGRRTALLKDSGTSPYSLSRTQMAVWTWLVINAYLFLYAMTHDPGVDIPVSMLGLLGISATTYLAAAMVDRSSPDAAPEPSHGFIHDIAGGSSVSLHRLQMIGWTLVLALAFIMQVLNKMSIPDFNPTLLGLMGLSAGTYIGFKFPENQQGPQIEVATKAAAATAGGQSGT
ncbi:MAG TPA: hypothetical protein VFK06_01060 [Candidatus Angelobacter sp.]|nr:hypothetical protein [Candidatus Angelobacter sp.]